VLLGAKWRKNADGPRGRPDVCSDTRMYEDR
jgi:hypothetical protein